MSKIASSSYDEIPSPSVNKSSGHKPSKQGPFIGEPHIRGNQETEIATTRKTMNWFFADKNRLFWTFQAFGWLGFLLLHILTTAPQAGGFFVSKLFFSFASSFVGFLTSTIFLRPIYRYARNQKPILLISITLISSVSMAMIMSAVKLPIFIVILGEEWIRDRLDQFGTSNFWQLLLPELPVNIFLILTWAGFYFGINYYLSLRNETERALFSARLADQAQLKMLRYQLNPHFLFNTLNAISTLVLSKQNKHANTMLTQLSAFLRYSLDSDPLQKTSLADEIKALQLYLEIEKTRFGQRLTVVQDIDAEVLNAKVPSLILQPAIENSIKYAIGVMESSGEIRIVAQRENNDLFLRVCDNGPNTPEDPNSMFTSKTGVGVVNMRDRLNHIYGDQHAFKLTKLVPNGLCVSMTIPFETMESK